MAKHKSFERHWLLGFGPSFQVCLLVSDSLSSDGVEVGSDQIIRNDISSSYLPYSSSTAFHPIIFCPVYEWHWYFKSIGDTTLILRQILSVFSNILNN